MAGLVISLGLAIYFKLDALWIPVSGSFAMLLPLVIIPVVSFCTKAFPESHLERIFVERIFGVREKIEKQRGTEKGLSFSS